MQRQAQPQHHLMCSADLVSVVPFHQLSLDPLQVLCDLTAAFGPTKTGLLNIARNLEELYNIVT